MTPDQMRTALSVEEGARRLKKQIDTYVLLLRGNRKETFTVGPLSSRGDNSYTPYEIDIPESARKHIFRMWRRETAEKYNALVRQLRQLGATTDLELIEFSPATGDPL